jgi:ribosomal protein L37E
MSKEEDKFKHSKRLHRAWAAIKKQLGIIKAHKNFGDASKRIDESQPHRLAKHHAMDCGQADCTLCGNPRHNRARKDKLTIQEKRNNQKSQDE